MNKKNKLLITVLLILIIILITVFTAIKMKESKEDKTKFGDIDVSQRELINDFLQKNPYISSMKNFEEGFIDNTDLVKSAISSSNVKLEYIVTEEINEMKILSKFDGYKKSIKNIEQYSKEIFGKENIQFNFVETFFDDSGYLIINDKYVYFTKEEQPEKVYIAVGKNEENSQMEVQIYEYTVNGNREKLENMLQTGIVDEDIPTSNKFVLKMKIDNEKIKILSKK